MRLSRLDTFASRQWFVHCWFSIFTLNNAAHVAANWFKFLSQSLLLHHQFLDKFPTLAAHFSISFASTLDSYDERQHFLSLSNVVVDYERERARESELKQIKKWFTTTKIPILDPDSMPFLLCSHLVNIARILSLLWREKKRRSEKRRRFYYFSSFPFIIAFFFLLFSFFTDLSQFFFLHQIEIHFNFLI